MEWTKSNISSAELEQKQQAYIKEALEMAKRSAKNQDDETIKAQERAAAEKKAAEEKAAAELRAAEKAESERRAAAEKRADEEKIEAERKAAEEKAEAERKAAEEKVEAERKAAKADKIETEKAAEGEREVEEERTAGESEVSETEDNSDSEAEPEELIDLEEFTEPIGSNDADEKCDECEDHGAEDTVSNEDEKGSSVSEKQEVCDDGDDELIDTAQLAHTKNPAKSEQKETAPANFNQYINLHNEKAQCNCPNCQRKRAMMQQ